MEINTCLELLRLKIWDTPGGDHFANTNRGDYLNADIIILTYCIDQESSFDNMADMYEKGVRLSPNAKFFMVGNKSDLDKEGRR